MQPRTKFDFNAFKDWLISNGAEILQPTNPYEKLRFKGRHIGVIYTSGNNSGTFVFESIKDFMSGKNWRYRPVNLGRKPSYKKQKLAILDRDGSDCFYCGNPLEDDVTLEHLQSLVSGGSNTLGNMVLAHEKCNHVAGNLTVSQKVKIALQQRIKKN